MNQTDRLSLRTTVRSTYDIQKLRIQMGNRIVGNFKAKLGQKPGENEDTLDPESRVLLANLRANYALLATALTTGATRVDPKLTETDPDDLPEEADLDGDEENENGEPKKNTKAERAAAKIGKLVEALLVTRYNAITDKKKSFPTKAKFTGDPVISSYAELCLMNQYLVLKREEESQFRRLESLLEDFPIWNLFLVKIKGLGPAMGAVLISEYDIHKAKYVSSLWCYAGLHVRHDVPPGPAGRSGASKRKEHLVKITYKDKRGKEQTRDGINYNSWLRTKLLGVLGTCFLRTPGCPYRALYDNKKHFYESHPVYGIHNDNKPVDPTDPKNKFKITNKGRRHAMAIRFMVKQFIIDLYKAWRPLEGLPVYDPYAQAKLGLPPHGEGQNPPVMPSQP